MACERNGSSVEAPAEPLHAPEVRDQAPGFRAQNDPEPSACTNRRFCRRPHVFGFACRLPPASPGARHHTPKIHYHQDELRLTPS